MTCSRMGIIYFILLVMPLLVIMPMIAIVVAAGNSLPDWALMIIALLIVGIAVYWIIGFTKKWGTIPCTVEISESELKVTLKTKSVFYPGTVFQSSWADLKSASSGYETQRQERFYKVQFAKPDLTIYLNSPEKLTDAEKETEFGSIFLAYVALQNSDSEKQGKQPIDTRNFYQSTWAKVITYLIWLALAGFIIAKISMPESINSWKVAQFGICSAIWLSSYYINTRKRK